MQPALRILRNLIILIRIFLYLSFFYFYLLRKKLQYISKEVYGDLLMMNLSNSRAIVLIFRWKPLKSWHFQAPDLFEYIWEYTKSIDKIM